MDRRAIERTRAAVDDVARLLTLALLEWLDTEPDDERSEHDDD